MSTWRWSRRRFLAGIAASSGATLLAQQGCSTRPVPKSALASDPTQLDLLGASRAIRDRSLSPVEITRACLERIARLDHRLNSFITVTAERAMAEAREAEAEVTSGRWRGPMHGIPIALKDNVDTAGVRTTAASAVFADRLPTEDAKVVQLLKAAGAIIVQAQHARVCDGHDGDQPFRPCSQPMGLRTDRGRFFGWDRSGSCCFAMLWCCWY